MTRAAASMNTTATFDDQFRCAIEAVGLTALDVIVPDGRVHRFASNGDRDDDAGWYVLYGDGVPAGIFGCFRMGIEHKWCAKANTTMSTTERTEYRRRLASAQRPREEQKQRRRAEAALRAHLLWDQAAPATADHPYLQKKGVRPHGLRVDRQNRLIIPVKIDDALTSLQFIGADGNKKFLSGGEVKGGSFILGDLTGERTIAIVEGFATGASVHEATGLPTVVAFSANNLVIVAQDLRRRFLAATILVCGDHDASGVGQAKAREAADVVGGMAMIPDETGMDWNDVAAAQGLEVVKQRLAAALTPLCILDGVHAFVGRFVAYPSEHAHVAHTLWIAHTHLMDAWESTPRLAALSPEPSSGKTRVLEVTETLVPHPVEAINTTPAYLFRKVSDPAGLPPSSTTKSTRFLDRAPKNTKKSEG
jgi:phage/plasmid primase-like uncharacterized protein